MISNPPCPLPGMTKLDAMYWRSNAMLWTSPLSLAVGVLAGGSVTVIVFDAEVIDSPAVELVAVTERLFTGLPFPV